MLKEQLPDENDDFRNTPGSMLREKRLPAIREYRDAMIEAAEKEYLTELMRRTRGAIKTACEISGLSESRLHALLRKYDVPRFREKRT
jgi:transcriptional regulator of acetoin/glycerol metabolism